MSPIPDDPNQAQAWISGEAPDQTIDFYIPRGNRGPIGPQGPMGPSLAVGLVETNMGPAAPGTVGPQGLTGPKGDPGGFTSGTELGTSNLNDVTTPGLYKATLSANVTLANNYPIAGTNGTGVLNVYQQGPTPASGTLQEYIPVWGNTTGRVVFMRTYSNSAWSTWRMLSTARWDVTAGRTLYQWDDLGAREQLIYGDTGERDIAASHGNGTFGALKVRRRDASVSIWVVGWVPPTNGAAVLNTMLPTGFRNPNSMAGVAIGNGSQLRAVALGANFSNLTVGGNVTTESYNFHLTYPTVDPWPTALPGTAVGIVPTS